MFAKFVENPCASRRAQKRVGKQEKRACLNLRQHAHALKDRVSKVFLSDVCATHVYLGGLDATITLATFRSSSNRPLRRLSGQRPSGGG